MPNYQTPGVYIVEHGIKSALFSGVPTGVPCFFGFAPQGKARSPHRVTSLEEFDATFGRDFPAGRWLRHSVRAFFRNGGTVCYVCRVNAKPGEDCSPGDYEPCFALLADVPDVSLIACPDAFLRGNATSVVDYEPIFQAAIAYAETHLCLAILDPPPMPPANEAVDRQARAGELRAFADRFRSTHAAIYAPWFEVVDPDAEPNGKTVFVPPSGFILGIFHAVDASVGVWKAPANVAVQGIVGMQLDFTNEESDLLNPEGVNLVRDFPGVGTRIWGARTTSEDVMWRYVNVRRLFLYIERTLLQRTQWVVFEPNDQPTWSKLVNAVEGFLQQIWREGGLQGASPEQAFQVRCGVPTTMTGADIANGLLKIEVGLAPVRPAEFLMLTVSQRVQKAS